MDTSGFTIVVRTTNNKDVNIQLNSSSTIHELKRKIQCDHPGSPEINRQKLIYNGRMLIDHHKIDTVIKETNTVIHLVYSTDEKTKSSTTATESPAPELRHRFQPNTSTTQTTYHHPHLGTAQTHDAHAYAAWMQHYHHHYNYYMQYYAGHQNHPLHAVPAQDPGTVPPNTNQENAQPQAPAAQEPAEVRDAQGRPMIADDDNGQDWLDVLFGFTRFGLMLSIIYFYSSTYRFIIAVTLLLIIYLYQAGVFRVNRRPRVPQNANANNAEQQQRDDNNNNSGESGDDEQTSPDTPPPPPPSIFATAFCFIRSFFSSLVPTGPPGVVN